MGGAAGVRTLRFRTPVYYDTTSLPDPVGGICPGDWNGDGNADLAWMTSGDLRVMLGHGDGTFGPPVTYARPTNATLVTAADVDGDGRADIVTRSTAGVGVMFGNGDGTFQSQIGFAAPNDSVSVGDFNSDRKPDLLLRGIDWSSTVATSNGDGTFDSRPGPDLGGSLPSAIADFDGDGELDIAFVDPNANGTLKLYFGRGDGTFQTPPSDVATAVGAVVAGDYDGDGKADLAAYVVGGVEVLFGNGDGTFDSTPNPMQPGRPLGSDFNGDGLSDRVQLFVPTWPTEYYLTVLESGGDGTFDPVDYDLTTRRPFSVLPADWNGDGHTDLAVRQMGRIAFFLSDAEGSLRGIRHYDKPPSTTMGLDLYGATIGDWNGDGKLDLAESDYNQNRVCVRLGSGDGSFQPPVNCAAASFPQELSTADWNGDGRADLLVVNNVVIVGLGPMMHLTVLLGRGDGTFDPLPMDPRYIVVGKIATGDIDADGKPDFVGLSSTSYVAIFRGNGDGTFQSSGSVRYEGSTFRVDLADVNSDGKLDIVNLVGATFSVALGNGDGTFQAATTGPRTEFTGAVFGDWNGDGTTDMAVGGSVQTASRIVLGGGVSVSADFDGDGRPDVAQMSSGGVAVWVNDGASGFRAPLMISVGAPVAQLFGGDLNRDGLPDLVVGSYNVILNSSY